MTSPAFLRTIAHESLALHKSPLLKHYKRGRFQVWNGIAMTGSELPGPGFNFAACLGTTPPLAEVLPVASAFFQDATAGWGILVEGGAGHPMEAELLANGWTVAEDEPAFVLNSWTPRVVNRADLTIRHVETAADRDAYLRVTMDAFQAPAEMAELFVPSLDFVHDPEIRLFVGTDTASGEDVTAVGYNISGPTAVIWGTATREAYRSRGIGTAMMVFALNEAFQNGCSSASLRSGPMSIALYERLGFRYACQHRTYSKA